jgi:enolase
LDRYPIGSVEDPLGQDDEAGFRELTAQVGSRLQIVGDDFLVTNALRVDGAARSHACNAVLIKPNQAGTVTEAKAALVAAVKNGFGTIVSARSGETEDTSVGSIARGERTVKWNELLRIEEASRETTRFANDIKFGMDRGQ